MQVPYRKPGKYAQMKQDPMLTAEKARELEAWADHLRKNFHPAFWNERTGWYAGWRCQADQLHDHAFLAVNGAVILLLFAVMVLLIGLVSEQIATLRVEPPRMHDDR